MLSFHSLHHSPMFGGDAALSDVLGAAAAAGFASMGVDLASITGSGLDTRLDDLTRAFGARDMRCSDVAVIAVAADRTATLDSARACARVARELGATTVVFAVRDDIEWSSLLAVSSECASLVAAAGARLAVEYLTYSPIATLEQAMRLCDGIGWARAVLLLDSLHVIRTGTDLDAIRALDGGQIELVQLADAPRAMPADVVDESRNGRLLPGKGGLDLGAFVDAVRSTGYQGDVGAEVLSAALRSADPLAVAAAVKAALERTWFAAASS